MKPCECHAFAFSFALYFNLVERTLSLKTPGVAMEFLEKDISALYIIIL